MEQQAVVSAWWSNIRHFRPEEFACPESGAMDMSRDLLVRLDAAREMAGVPFRITSGKRSASHNERVGGVPGSAHVSGLAADIAAGDGRMRFAIVKALLDCGVARIGIGDGFVHADVDAGKPGSRIWLYR